MILYATTSSERATKGQGGNKFITVQITGSDEMPIATLQIEPIEGDKAELKYWDNSMTGDGFTSHLLLPKGNQKKDETCSQGHKTLKECLQSQGH